MRTLIKTSISLILAVSAFAQAPGFFGSNFTSASGVTYVSSTYNTTNIGTSPCPSGVCTFTGVTFSNSGDSVLISIQVICSDTACMNDAVTPTFTASDGTNTYTPIAGCTVGSTQAGSVFVSQGCMYAANVTAGTYNIAVTITTGNNSYYPALGVIELSGGNASSPLDASVTASVGATSATPSLTSAGNISSANEIAVAFLATTSSASFSWSAPFTQMATFTYGGVTLVSLAIATHPSSGSTITATGTQTSGAYQMSLVAIKP